jgi:hypothetical protein
MGKSKFGLALGLQSLSGSRVFLVGVFTSVSERSKPSTSTSLITTKNPSRSSGPRARATFCKRSFRASRIRERSLDAVRPVSAFIGVETIIQRCRSSRARRARRQLPKANETNPKKNADGNEMGKNCIGAKGKAAIGRPLCMAECLKMDDFAHRHYK